MLCILNIEVEFSELKETALVCFVLRIRADIELIIKLCYFTPVISYFNMKVTGIKYHNCVIAKSNFPASLPTIPSCFTEVSVNKTHNIEPIFACNY